MAQSSIPEDPNLQLWAARYNGPPNSFDHATSVAASPDGSTVFVAGSSEGSGSSADYATVAYSVASGEELWAVRYNGPGNFSDFARSLAVSPDGSKVFVTGASPSFGSSHDYATLAYSAASGAELWAARYNGPANFSDIATSVTVSLDSSKVFVTGSSYGSGSREDYATVAYSTASGAQLWASRYNGPTNSSDSASSLSASADGSKIFVTGSSASDYATLAYSAATGVQLWAVRYNGPANSSDIATSLAVSPDSSKVFVTGSSYGVDSDADYATLAYSAASGAALWSARFDGPGTTTEVSTSDDFATSLAVSPDGTKVFVTGSSVGLVSAADYATLAYSAASGAALWSARYNGPGNADDLARSLRVSPDSSKVFVTGASDSLDSSADYATFAYSAATGAEVWVARYNGPSNDWDSATSLAVSPDGFRVFVTGPSVGSRSATDYITLAYRANTCANGKDEAGPASGVVHNVEPQAGPAAPYVHGINCDVVAANGL